MGTEQDTSRGEPTGPAAHARHVPAESRSPNPRHRTLIVSDVRLYRDGLALALGSREDLEILDPAHSFARALEQLAASPPTVVLLDIGMPSALDVARAMMRAAPDTTIVAVAVSEISADVVACAEAGVAGYVSRDASIDEVIATIHSVMRGEVRCAPHVVATLFRRLASRTAPAADDAPGEFALTPRELEIVGLIDEGLSNKEIGKRLLIGTPTVKNHVHHILDKLHVRRRGEAAARVRGRHAISTRALSPPTSARTVRARAD